MRTSTMLPAVVALAAGMLAQAASPLPPLTSPALASGSAAKACSKETYGTIDGVNHTVTLGLLPEDTHLAALKNTPVTVGADGGLLVGAPHQPKLLVSLDLDELRNDKGVKLSMIPTPRVDHGRRVFTPRFVTPVRGTARVQAAPSRAGPLVLLATSDDLSYFGDLILCRGPKDPANVWNVLFQEPTGDPSIGVAAGCHVAILQLPDAHCTY